MYLIGHDELILCLKQLSLDLYGMAITKHDLA